MTTKPKARKYRIRRGDAAVAGGAGAAEGVAHPHSTPETAPEDLLSKGDRAEDGFGERVFPGAAAYDETQADGGQVVGDTAHATSPQQSTDAEIAAIRAEGLTGRQLRLARRTAQKHGLSPNSDFDAVRMLRQRGINPFGNANLLELLVNDGQGSGGGDRALPVPAGAPGLVPAPPGPATPPPGRPAPLTADERAVEIMRVQRDIARRRRKRLILLFTRLSFFVLLPTLLVGYYYFRVATPLYATSTEFVIQKAESSAPSGLSGLFGGTSFATVQESITVQSYLQSREAMLRLDEELNFREHFSSPDIDVLTRLDPDSSDEEMFDTYRRHLTIGYDPTEGLVKMEVVAADPETSQAFSEALIGYAEERVDQMSRRLRGDQMAGARASFEDAEARASEAQARVLDLQQRRGILSAEAEVSAVFQQIGNFEMELQQERLRLDELLSVTRPNATRVEVAERNIARLEALIAELRSSLVDAEEGGVSLARVQSELVVAQGELETRQIMLAQALQQLESARIEADRQSLYLSLGVFPVAPDEAAYPRAFENTLLAFLIFSGIYLLVSMTASILREQVSS